MTANMLLFLLFTGANRPVPAACSAAATTGHSSRNRRMAVAKWIQDCLVVVDAKIFLAIRIALDMNPFRAKTLCFTRFMADAHEAGLLPSLSAFAGLIHVNEKTQGGGMENARV